MSLLFTTSLFSQETESTKTTTLKETSTIIATDDFFELSLEELMNMEVSVTGKNKMSLRETPGIVTVITQQEIEKSGARDLADILRTIPGFELAGEAENVLGLGIRGNYALEGKVLLLMDGQQMNETNYGSMALGNHYLLGDVKKIEIIRGPGSAIYGGTAELAVINIITKTGEEMDGGYGSVTYGNSEGSTSRVIGQFGVGKKLSNGLNLSFTGSYSEANRSNQKIDYNTNYLSADGERTTFNYADSSKTKNLNLNIGAKYKGLAIKAIIQDHKIEKNDNNAAWLNFGGVYIGGKYDWVINEKLIIIPQISWKQEKPWSYTQNVSESYDSLYVATNTKLRGNITVIYKPIEQLGITIGTEAYQDKSNKPYDNIKFNSNNESSVSYNNIAAYAEVALQNKIANFVLGARYDNHSQFGDAFVPRFAITKVINKFHAKALFSRAFKAPTIQNIEGNPDIKPEFTSVVELELGYLLTGHMAISGNIFYNKIDNPIIYYTDQFSDDEGYENYESTSTIGVELDYRLKYNWGYVNSSYSFYINNNTKAAPYEVENDQVLLRGFPTHKVIVTSGINIGQKFNLGPTFIINSKKIGYFYQQEYWAGYPDPTVFVYDLSMIFNLVAHYELIKDLQLSVGVYDILGQNFVAANAYDAGYAGTPMMGQEFLLKLHYKF